MCLEKASNLGPATLLSEIARKGFACALKIFIGFLSNVWQQHVLPIVISLLLIKTIIHKLLCLFIRLFILT